jgi:hypothetical protein
MRLSPLFVSCILLAGCSDAREPIAPATGVPFQASVSPTVLSAPVFGLAALGSDLVAAETFVGVTALTSGGSNLLASLPGVTGVAPAPRDFFAVTGAPLDPALEPGSRKLYRLLNGRAVLVADLGAFENTVNPDQVWNSGPPDSNPFNVVSLGGERLLVADAAANAILSVRDGGRIDWVVVLPPLLIPAKQFRRLIGCPGSGAPECKGLPDRVLAQPVSTSIAVGPGGAWYAGELTGFPGEPGHARIWRITPGTNHVVCPASSCTVAVNGLTSIVDLKFGPNGLLYVAELDADGWISVELKAGGGPLMPSAGGRIKACDVVAGTCTVIASGLSLPTALAFDAAGNLWVAENSAIPGVANVHIVP